MASEVQVKKLVERAALLMRDLAMARAERDEARAERDAALGVLKTMATVFRTYEDIHLAKGTADGEAKAKANAAHADVCEAVLSRAAARRGG